MINVLKPGSTRPVQPVDPGPGGETGFKPNIRSDQPGRVLPTRRSNRPQKTDQPGNPLNPKQDPIFLLVDPELNPKQDPT